MRVIHTPCGRRGSVGLKGFGGVGDGRVTGFGGVGGGRVKGRRVGWLRRE